MQKKYKYKQKKSPRRSSHRISDHFSKRDFECKSGLAQKEFKVSLGLVGALELLKSLTKKRIEIIKGYQCQKSCENENQIKRNFHALGLAADIKAQGLDIKTLLFFAEKIQEFKGIGINFEKDYLHVDTRKEKKRILWVEKNNKDIMITTENKETYLPDIPLQTEITHPEQPD